MTSILKIYLIDIYDQVHGPIYKEIKDSVDGEIDSLLHSYNEMYIPGREHYWVKSYSVLDNYDKEYFDDRINTAKYHLKLLEGKKRDLENKIKNLDIDIEKIKETIRKIQNDKKVLSQR